MTTVAMMTIGHDPYGNEEVPGKIISVSMEGHYWRILYEPDVVGGPFISSNTTIFNPLA